MRYLIDTNILLQYIRGSETAKIIDVTFNPLDNTINQSILSVVCVGEIKSLAKRQNWGLNRIKILENLCNELIIADIYSEDILERYAEIDAYSQGKLLGRPLNDSARNMGKNDLWIAATASVLNATILTTDQDFNHLNGEFLKVECVKI
jgi:tRNA(fMet)-specific endonuclease VapC